MTPIQFRIFLLVVMFLVLLAGVVGLVVYGPETATRMQANFALGSTMIPAAALAAIVGVSIKRDQDQASLHLDSRQTRRIHAPDRLWACWLYPLVALELTVLWLFLGYAYLPNLAY